MITITTMKVMLIFGNTRADDDDYADCHSFCSMKHIKAIAWIMKSGVLLCHNHDVITRHVAVGGRMPRTTETLPYRRWNTTFRECEAPRCMTELIAIDAVNVRLQRQMAIVTFAQASLSIRLTSPTEENYGCCCCCLKHIKCLKHSKPRKDTLNVLWTKRHELYLNMVTNKTESSMQPVCEQLTRLLTIIAKNIIYELSQERTAKVQYAYHNYIYIYIVCLRLLCTTPTVVCDPQRFGHRNLNLPNREI